MSKYLNDKNLHILTNIMSGIQTYGQRYSDERDWGNFTPAYAATANEVSITIGWASNYGDQARRLLQLIQTKYPNDFYTNDKAGIAEDIKKSFTTPPYYQPARGSAKARSITAIISSPGGKKCQDELFAELIETYLDHAINYGINKNNIKALMMWCELEHLGGPSPVKRIFGRCGLNPSLDAIMMALKKDQQNGNTTEVGDRMFQSRHDCCYKWINQYVQEENLVIIQSKEEKGSVNQVMTITIDFSKYYGLISNSGSDQRGTYSGGQAGDQTGGEWNIRTWYNRPWHCVLRYPDQKVGNLIAELGIQAANNNLIGYDQYQRQTYWEYLRVNSFRPSQIKNACEADCSAGVIANTKAAGYILGIPSLMNLNASYTGNMKAGYAAAGFQILTDYKYLSGYDYLLPGDILLNETYHTATNLGIGRYANYINPEPTPAILIYDRPEEYNESFIGNYKVNASDGLNMRIGPNKNIIINIPNQEIVNCKGYYTNTENQKWLYVFYKQEQGFCCAEYLDKIDQKKEETKEQTGYTISFTKKFTGIVTADSLWVRKWAGVEYDPLDSIPIIYKNQKVDICDTVKASNGKKWYFIKIKDVYGFASASYIRKI